MESRVTSKPDLERRFEHTLFAARWLMAPIYLGLAIALVMLVIVFARDLVYYAPRVVSASSEQAILVVLTLIDLALAGNLILLVIYSGYENFVSKLDFGDSEDRPTWMDFVDFSSLKLNLLASIVGISAIYLLRWFMEIGESEGADALDDIRLRWLVIIHLTFVASGVLLALMDWLSARASKY
jgi:uncharacterized protein (TIGR00645 family)